VENSHYFYLFIFFSNKVVGIHLDLHDVSLGPHGGVIRESALVLQLLWRLVKQMFLSMSVWR